MVELEIVKDQDMFAAMGSELRDIYTRAGYANPYTTHDWLSSWWDAYKKGKELSIIIFRDSSRLIGFIPLALTIESFFGISIRTLKFFADHWGTMDFIIAEKRDECIGVFLDWFRDTRAADILTLSRMSKESDNAKALEKLIKEHKCQYEKIDLKNTVIHLEKDWDSYVNGLSKKFRYEIKHKKKMLSEIGDLKYERIKDVKNPENILESMAEVADKSWKEKDKKGIAVSEEGRQFYRNIISRWNAGNSLDVSLLRLDNRPIAFAARINSNNKFYALETAYDQSLFDYSPGLVVHSYLLESLYKDGEIDRYELGEEDGHKRRWSSEYDDEVKYIIYNKTIFPQLAYRLHAICGKRRSQ